MFKFFVPLKNRAVINLHMSIKINMAAIMNAARRRSFKVSQFTEGGIDEGRDPEKDILEGFWQA